MSFDPHADARRRHPGFVEAVRADAAINASYRGERNEFTSDQDLLLQCLRLSLVSDAFLGQVLYRAKAALQAKGVPILPRLLHRLAMATCQVAIGDPVVVNPGIYLAHGQVVIDGIIEIGSGTCIFPWVTIGLKAGAFHGPTIGRNVHIGTGAKVLGPITIADGARIGANAVVTTDVGKREIWAGVPARKIGMVPAGA